MLNSKHKISCMIDVHYTLDSPEFGIPLTVRAIYMENIKRQNFCRAPIRGEGRLRY
ncbi:hypothetical protein AGR8A_Cc60403 [Agrobacterium fabrum str. J-07]|nr:hypothetical protein AGR8A_Cc60403 [Agrobacterium fabrum str. J-07]